MFLNKWIYVNTLSCLLFLKGILLSGADAVDVEAGQDVTLTCPLAGTFPVWQGPLDWINLQNDNQASALEERLQYVDDKDLLITNVTTLYSGTYRCIQGSQEATMKLVVSSYNPHVKILRVMDGVIPLNATAMVLPLRVNKSENITCFVWNAYPKPNVTISIPGTTINSNNTTEWITIVQNNTITVTMTATIGVTNSYEGKSVVCEAIVGGKKSQSTETIKVVREPTLFVTTGMGDYYRTRNKGNFSCDALVSWPTTTFTWDLSDVNNDPTRFAVHPTECKQRSTDLSYNCSSRVEAMDLRKEDNGRVLACNIFFLKKRIQTYSLDISYFFPPTKAEIAGPDVIDAYDSKNVSVTCTTDSARNTRNSSNVRFTWLVQDHEINPKVVNNTDTAGGANNGYIPSQTVSFQVKKSMNGKNVECKAKGGIDSEYVQASKRLNIRYSPSILRPSIMTAYAYKGDTLEVNCTVDSNPAATVTWMKNGNAATVKDTDQSDNIASLFIEGISDTHEGQYTCKANNGVAPTSSKTITVEVYDKPSAPQFDVAAIAENSAEVEVITSSQAPAVPRTFYVQFKPSTSQQWLNIDEPITDTYSGESPRSVKIKLPALLPGTSYEYRVKSVDENQLSFYSDTSQFTTIAEDDNMKTQREYTTAILVSVFVTFGIMLIILIVVIVVLRKRGSSSF